MKAREAEIERWFRRPNTRRALAWGIGGFAVGCIFVLVVMLLFGPQPQAVRSSSPAGTAAVSVTVNDTFLTQVIRTGIEEAHLPVTVTNVQAHILPKDEVAISADAVGLPGLIPSRLSATGQLYVSDGKLLIHLMSASIGGVALPGPVRGALEAGINSQIAPLETNLVPTKTPYQITSISTHDGLLTMNLNPV